MTPADKPAFVATVMGFAELKGKELSLPALELYWRAMQRWEIEDFQQAAEHLLGSCTFMPTPKDFEDLRKAGRLTAGEAWVQVLGFVRKGYSRMEVGLWRDQRIPAIEDPAIVRAVAAIGGYEAIAMSPTDKTHFLEKRFAEHFEAMQDAEDVREAVPAIANSAQRLDGPQRITKLLERPEPT